MIRDFSDAAKANLIHQIKEVTPNGIFGKVADYFGDIWLGFQEKYGSLNIQSYVNDVDTYHKMILDRNDTEIQQIEEIFQRVHEVDEGAGGAVRPLADVFEQERSKIKRLEETLTIPTFRFTPDTIQAIQSGTKNPSDFMINEADYDQTKYQEFYQWYNGRWTSTGCAITSAAYVLTMLGIETSPLDAYHRNGNSTYIYWNSVTQGKATWSGHLSPSRLNELAIQSKSDNNKSQLILNVNNGGHFVVLKDVVTDANGNITQYKVFDPWKAQEKSYTPETIGQLKLNAVSYYQKG